MLFILSDRTRRSLYLLTALSALFALLGVASMIAWRFAPSFVERVDNTIKDWYDHRHSRALERAQELHKSGRTRDAIESLLAALEDHTEVRKADRLDALVRREMTYLVDLYSLDGQHAEAVRWARRRLEFDPLDLAAAVDLAGLLLATEETRAEGVDVLRTLGRRDREFHVRNHLAVRESYLTWMIERGNRSGAAELAAPLAQHVADVLGTRGIEVSWGLSNAVFNPESSRRIPAERTDDGRWRVRFTLPDTGVRMIRLGFPALTHLEVRDLEWVFHRRSGSSSTMRWVPGAARLHQLKEVGGALVTSGAASTVTIGIPETFATSSGSHIDVSFRATPGAAAVLYAATAAPPETQENGDTKTGPRMVPQ